MGSHPSLNRQALSFSKILYLVMRICNDKPSICLAAILRVPL
jgi:hypothetical protein